MCSGVHREATSGLLLILWKFWRFDLQRSLVDLDDTFYWLQMYMTPCHAIDYS